MAKSIAIRNPAAPTSVGQGNYIRDMARTLGREIAIPATMGEASALIESLKPEVQAARDAAKAERRERAAAAIRVVEPAGAAPAPVPAPGPAWRARAADRPKPPEIPDGYYCVLIDQLRFYRVVTRKTGPWAGRQFVQRYSSDALVRIGYNENFEARQAIAVDPQVARERFARETGRCHYCGKRLTDEDSLAWLYGPECARQRGLPHGPKHEVQNVD